VVQVPSVSKSKYATWYPKSAISCSHPESAVQDEYGGRMYVGNFPTMLQSAISSLIICS
jgi:hypothetical protein